MKKRTNVYLDEQDKQDLAIIRQQYHLDSDAAGMRFAVHHVAEEVRKRVSREKGEHRQNSTT